MPRIGLPCYPCYSTLAWLYAPMPSPDHPDTCSVAQLTTPAYDASHTAAYTHTCFSVKNFTLRSISLYKPGKRASHSSPQSVKSSGLNLEL